MRSGLTHWVMPIEREKRYKHWAPRSVTSGQPRFLGLFLNLFNLIPLSPLDGGRITAVLSPRIWLLGVPILIGVFLWNPSPMLLVIAVLAAPQVWKAFRYDPSLPENQAYYGVSAEARVTYAAYYLILLVVLGTMSYEVHEMLGPQRG